MKKNNWGRIVNIASIAAFENMGPVTYCVAKSSLAVYSHVMGRILASEKKNIVITCILPGVVKTKTGHWSKVLKNNPEHAEKYLKERCPLGRFGTSKEIADTIVFYCSDLVSFSQGAIIPVDGGQKSVRSMLHPLCFHAYSSGGAKAKTAHFARISKATGRPLTEMVFFDDLPENVQVASQQGVTSVLIGRTGLTMAAFKCGLEAFTQRLAQAKEQKQEQKIEATTSIKESPNEVQASVSEGQDASGTSV